jgi:DNA repair exonuclease SbcCD ATPase subunit|tara:strand:- start:1053 stop:2453 length:1401 start_codon:yes stop_codon:yes gene_type:complete
MSETTRIAKMEIENFKGIELLSIDAEGNHVAASGPNGSGKSTFLDAVFYALAGHSRKDLPDPVRHGADKGQVWIELDNGMRIRRMFSKNGNSRLEIHKGDTKYKSPQEILDGMFVDYCLNPDAFLRQRPQDQLETLMALSGLDAKKVGAKVVKITSDDADKPETGESVHGYLSRLAADNTGKYYTRRTELGRVLDQKTNALDVARKSLEDLGGAPDDSEEPPTVAEIAERLSKLQATRATREGLRLSIQSSEERLKAVSENTKILEKQKKQIDERLAKHHISHTEALAARENAKADLAGIPNPEKEIHELSEQINEVAKQMEAITQRKNAQQFADRIESEVEGARNLSISADKTLSKLRELRNGIMNGIDVGVEGLSIQDGALYFNDIPLPQASTSEQYILAIAVAANTNPAVRLLRIDNGEHLDENTLKMLYKLADERDFQVLITSVKETENGELVVKIVQRDPA